MAKVMAGLVARLSSSCLFPWAMHLDEETLLEELGDVVLDFSRVSSMVSRPALLNLDI